MTHDTWDAPKRDGAAPSAGPYVTPAPVDPLGIRAKLMLETSSFMMSEPDWPYRQTTVELRSQGDEDGLFRLFGANHPDSVRRVFERQLDIAILNPSVVLSMGHRGVGLFSEPMEVALVAVIPHFDQLGFAVSKASGLTSLDDIREKRFPLRLSVRGSLDLSTTQLVELVLQAHGFGYADILAWGGSVSYDQPMPMPGDESRLGRAARGEIDAIFEEGVMLWANGVEDAGLRFLDLEETRLAELERLGFQRGTIERSRYGRLPADVATVDFSGWPIYTRRDASDLLIRKFCEGMEARKSSIPSHIGPLQQPNLPLERMVIESAETPLNVPFHPAAREVWTRLGYLQETES
jgi:TRAP-type uncharacterized transport system substrate-binding protein